MAFLTHVSNHLQKYGVLYLALGLAPWLENFIRIEWTFAYCHNPEDGPASAVFGLPLPYIRWSGASSMQYLYMPHIYLINLLCIAGAFYLCLKWLLKSATSRPRYYLGIIGAVLLIVYCSLFTFLNKDNVLKPTLSIGDAYGVYTSFRPVKFPFSGSGYRCTPSRYWFPDDWKGTVAK